MNYRHAYHAGNFADVVKHTVLALVIDYMKRKDAPFRVIDTHAGRGRYDLASAQAAKTQEWQSGIGRLLGSKAEALPPPLGAALAVYLEAVRAENGPDGRLACYPGSPAIALRLLRRTDTLVANEAHPEEHEALKANLLRLRRTGVRIMAIDGWIALRALLPPKERRGVVLIDPPFEEPGELERLALGLREGLQRFATGTFIAWYPIKDAGTGDRLRKAATGLSANLLAVEFLVRQPRNPDLLNGCGLMIANPPFLLQSQCEAFGPLLARRLAQGPGAKCSVRPLNPL
jgi:23S rRNA (adenine2030-N6)-methyltransferase